MESSVLKELVRLTVVDVVDNEIDGMTSACKSACCTGEGDESGMVTYNSHFTTMLGRDHALDMRKVCLAAHGLSLYLEAEFEDDNGNRQFRRLLFDAGPEPSVWRTNAERLDLPLADIDAVVLSHYHIDHAGGLRAAVPDICQAKKQRQKSENDAMPPLMVDLHHSKIVERAVKTSADGPLMPILPLNPTVEELENFGAQVSLRSEAHTVCDDCFYVSGEILRKTTYETGLQHHFTKNEKDEWVEDTMILDERYVACRLKGRGLVVFTSCSHAGVINVCTNAKEDLQTPITAVVGGLHLSGSANETRIDTTVRDLRQFDLDLLLVGHCTGWKAKAKLQRAFESCFQPLSVGGSYVFHATDKKRREKASDTVTNKKSRKERSEPTRAEGVPKRGRLEYFKGEEGTRMRLEGVHVSGSSADKKSCVMCFYEVIRKGVIARQPAKSNNFCKTCGVYLCRSPFSGQEKSCFDKFHSQNDIERIKRDVVQPKQGRGKKVKDEADESKIYEDSAGVGDEGYPEEDDDGATAAAVVGVVTGITGDPKETTTSAENGKLIKDFATAAVTATTTTSTAAIAAAAAAAALEHAIVDAGETEDDEKDDDDEKKRSHLPKSKGRLKVADKQKLAHV